MIRFRSQAGTYLGSSRWAERSWLPLGYTPLVWPMSSILCFDKRDRHCSGHPHSNWPKLWRMDLLPSEQFSRGSPQSYSISDSWHPDWRACWNRSCASWGNECCSPWIASSSLRGSQSAAIRTHWKVWKSKWSALRPTWSNTHRSGKHSYDCNCASASDSDLRPNQIHAPCRRSPPRDH